MLEILNFFSKNISENIKMYLKGQPAEICKKLEEIRIRSNGSIALKFIEHQEILENRIVYQDILDTLQIMCENSIYSYQNEIKNGFITVKGGHRVGISGNCVIENGKVININYISGMNFRIAKEIPGCSNKALEYILNLKENSVYNTLIVSPPGAGKTTLLRDIIKNISNGIDDINFKGMNVGLVDERGEIAALYKGIPQNNIGIRTDVLENVSKPIGIKMLIRSMAPQVISADEIGQASDIEAIEEAVCSRSKRNFHGSWRRKRGFIKKSCN